MKIIDLKDSPYKDSTSKNGFDSVSIGAVILKTDHSNVPETPHCITHGAMNKVDKSGLWRCIACNVGCFQINETKYYSYYWS